MSSLTDSPEQRPSFAQVGSAYYPVLVAVFTALVIISNVTATKGVAFGPIITDGGFIVFPLTYVIGDVLSEVYGFKAARKAILLGFGMNALAAAAIEIYGEDRVTVVRDLAEAIDRAATLAEAGEAFGDPLGSGAVLVTGSVVTVGEARSMLLRRGQS